MINVTILDNNYKIRNEWKDNTIRQMGKAQKYINDMPEWLKNYLYTDEEAPVSDQKLLTFYIDWIELFSNIPREYLESEIEVTETNDISLLELFGLVSKFLGEPNEDEIGSDKVINFKGKEYHLIESVFTAGGVEKMLAGATYKHFSESQALATLFQKKQYRKWEYLSKMTAILFRSDKNDMYDEEAVKMRADMFKDLPVSEAYRGYFFLGKHIEGLQESIVISLMERKASLSEARAKKSLKTSTGKGKLTRLLKRVFSIGKD